MNVWAFSDIHGNYTLFKEIKNFIGPEDKIFFLGDACDRGPNGWKIIKEILADNRFIYIKGNHEDMMIKAYKESFNKTGINKAKDLWFWNGGKATADEMALDSPAIIKKVMKELEMFPLSIGYTNTNNENICMSHSGWWPEENEDMSDEDLLWDRFHFYSKKWTQKDFDVMVHGHTPIPLLVDSIRFFNDTIPEEIEPGAFWYCEGHKVDIDCGTHFTNTAVLLNLDTFDEEIFTIE